MTEILKNFKSGWGFLTVAIFLAFWEIIARFNLLPGHLLPPFSVVTVEF